MRLGSEWGDLIEAVSPSTYERRDDPSAWDRILARKAAEFSHAKIPTAPGADSIQRIEITAKRLPKNPFTPAVILWGAFAALIFINMLNERGNK